MNRQSMLWIICCLITLSFLLATPAAVHSEEILFAHGMRGGRMMGGDGRIIHQLFANHDQIYRSVEEIPGGIRTITESDNPQVTALIQEHVPRMYQRIENRRGIPMIMMSSTLPIMAQNSDLYSRQWEMTSKGIMVTEISDDPEMIAVIRKHAREVTGFVETGMPGMMNPMMR